MNIISNGELERVKASLGSRVGLVLAGQLLFERFMDLEIKETTYVNTFKKNVLKPFNVSKSSIGHFRIPGIGLKLAC